MRSLTGYLLVAGDGAVVAVVEVLDVVLEEVLSGVAVGGEAGAAGVAAVVLSDGLGTGSFLSPVVAAGVSLSGEGFSLSE